MQLHKQTLPLSEKMIKSSYSMIINSVIKMVKIQDDNSDQIHGGSCGVRVSNRLHRNVSAAPCI